MEKHMLARGQAQRTCVAVVCASARTLCECAINRYQNFSNFYNFHLATSQRPSRLPFVSCLSRLQRFTQAT